MLPVLAAAANTIVIGVPAADSGRVNVEADETVTVRISGLTNPTAAVEAPVTLRQGTVVYDHDPATSGDQNPMIKVFEALTGVEASVDNMMVGEDGVTLTIKFTSPTGGANTVVTLPNIPAFEGIITDAGALDDNYAIDPADGTADGQVDYEFAEVATATGGDTITIPGAAITEDEEFSFTIGPSEDADGATDGDQPGTGIVNPENSVAATFSVKEGAVAPAQMDTIYFTNEDQISLVRPEAGKSSTLNPFDANAEDVTMVLRFESVVEVNEDTMIWVDLNDDFGGFSTRNVTVTQDDADGMAQEVSTVTTARGTNAFYISEDEDGDNVEMGDVTVTITDLTNPDMVGRISGSAIVRQGGFAAVGVDFSLQGAEISTSTPGADVRVEISTGTSAMIRGGEDITVTLEDFGIPGTIDESDIIIQTQRNTNPADVSVDGDDITLSLPTTIGDTVEQYNINRGAYSIIFKQGAGLTNPTSGGGKDITVSDGDSADHEMTVTIESSVSVKPSFVASGDDATVTAKGLEDGTATVHLQAGRSPSDSDMVLGSGTASDGVVEIVIDTSDLELGAMRSGDIDKGENTLYVKDASNDVVGETTIGIKPTIKLGSDSVKRSGKLEITVSDWYYGDINRVAIGGVEVDETIRDTISVGSDNKETFKVTVPASVRFGKQEVKVEGENDDGLKTFSVTDEVTVDALAITISPSTVVPGAQVTITGSGYVEDEEVMEITIGEKPAKLPTSSDDRKATSAGRIAYTITVPLDVGKGEKDVQVTVGTGDDERVGVGEITVPEPSIELDPAESVPGSVISVNGSGFASSGRVEVRYKDAIEEVGRADSSGDFHIRLEIPSDAGVGKKNEVKVEVRGTTSINATAEHKTPGSAIMVPETAQVGTLVTVSGTNFEPFSNLDVRIGGKDATPSPGPETDKMPRSLRVRNPGASPRRGQPHGDHHGRRRQQRLRDLQRGDLPDSLHS